MNIQLKKLSIPSSWAVLVNRFVDLEPDNNYPVETVYDLFDENLLHAHFEDYFIDLGYYGGYSPNRDGFFRLYIAKGNFLVGELFESFSSRSTDAITAKLDYYFNNIPAGALNSIRGHTYDEDTGDIEEFSFYSAVTSEAIKLSPVEFQQRIRTLTIK